MKTTSKTGAVLALWFFLLIPMQAGAETVHLAEASLEPSSIPAALHTGPDGRVYLIDEENTTLWRINPADGSYEQFFPAGLMDAMPDSAGRIWWTDWGDSFGSFDLNTNPVDMYSWKVPQNANGDLPDLGPIVLQNDQLWMATYYSSANFGIYQFAPGSGDLCHYIIPGGVYASDLVMQGTDLWWLNYENPAADTIMRLTITTGDFVRYELNRNIGPKAGMLVSGDFLWWAEDTLNGKIARFNTKTREMTTFDLLADPPPHPVKVGDYGGKVWYSDYSGSFGALDPHNAAGSPVTLMPSLSSQITPDCQKPAKHGPLDGSPFTGSLSWSEVESTSAQPQAGLEVYALPSGAAPVAITAAGNGIWVADSGRKKLVRLDIAYQIFLPLARK